MSSGAPAGGYEDRLRAIGESAIGAPPVERVVARGRYLRPARRRRQVGGQRWRATGLGLAPGELARMVDALAHQVPRTTPASPPDP